VSGRTAPTGGLFDDSLAAPFTRLDDAVAVRIVVERWGVAPVGLRRLDTERDDSFVVDSPVGRHVLKVAHPLDDPDVLDFQCAALAHAAQVDPGLPLSRLVPTVDGRTQPLVVGADGEPRVARLLTYLHGHPLDYRSTTSGQRRQIGAAVGRLSAALAGFGHPAQGRTLLWDLAHVGLLRPLLVHVVDKGTRAEVERGLDEFDSVVGPGLAAMRAQVIHNDANVDNLLVDPSHPAFVTGVLDFGDLVHSSVVADLAVAMSYAVGTDGADVWAAAYDLAHGFAGVRPLHEDEVRLLPSLVRMRIVQRLLLNSWLAATDPGNAHYTGRAIARTAAALHLLGDTPAPTDLVPGA
jgi:Ser/Thr protein kinase RdoA (MazF antagonist)